MREAARVTAETPAGTKMALEPALPTVGDLMAKHYPPALREAGIGGTVRVRVRVHANGTVDGYELVGSSGHAALDEAGMRVLREMVFVPTKSTNGEIQNTINQFNLEFNPKRRVRSELPTQAPADSASLPRKMSSEPTFTPYTDRPQLQNRDETAAALVRNYSAELRDAGIGGTSLLWLLLDETGKVVQTRVKETSGHAEIDAAAQRVGMEMRFTPARNGAEAVPVWIALPIVMKSQ